jgi:S-adenosylmethionine synthetase
MEENFMLEKVNKYHPDKIADRIAGAIVDYAYALDDNPKIAVEVLVGHGRATVTTESSVVLRDEVVNKIVQRFVDVDRRDIDFIQVPQDAHLAENQRDCVRCGDNGVFTAKWNADYEKATALAMTLGERFPSDGKYMFDFAESRATICQSNANANIRNQDVLAELETLIINPLGDWTGGTDTDTGCTNRKLGSDQPLCNPNGLHGKDLSKADVSVSVYINDLSRKLGGALVKAHCSIGDETVLIEIENSAPTVVPFADIVAFARDYIRNLGGFEKFAEYGMRWLA